jgi:cytochrome d ubiquinol oxidase subunit II
MRLAEVPLILMLVGLAAYAVLGGADFGAGFWQLTEGRSERDHAHHAIGPVWETNHVWLIFVLVLCWTAYPTAFGSIASTLAIPLFIAAVGIILRGTAYAMRSATTSGGEQRRVQMLFALSSIVTPFALGTVVGGIASFRVPVGNAEGDQVSSWVNWTSVLIGVLAVATAAYLAAVYLAADAVRIRRHDLADAFRRRALLMGVIAGGVAIAGLAVVHQDAHPLWEGLSNGAGLGAVIVSAVAGVTTILLVWRRQFEPARVTAALAVAAVIAGWALAQRPTFLPGLTIDEAAADRGTLVAILASLAAGAVVLLPSLALLFALVLRGRFDAEASETGIRPATPKPIIRQRRLLTAAVTSLVVGAFLMVVFGAGWAHLIGVLGLLAFVALGFVTLAATIAAGDEGT